MQDFYKLVAKASFFFIIGVILSSLFAWCVVQAIIDHLGGAGLDAFWYYLLSCFAGIAALGNYIQAKQTFRFARLE